MKISVIAANELDAALVQRWKQVQADDASLSSPYYCPEFSQLVASTGRAVRVAVLEEQGGAVGFFPHEKDSWGRLRPVGRALNDYHGLIARPGLNLGAGALLSGCGATYFAFNHLPMTQTVFAPFVHFGGVSPVMDLQGGWEAYVQRLCAAQNTRSPGVLTTVRQSAKRLERDVGPLRFVLHEDRPDVLQTLMRLKSEQRARLSGSADDPFALPWVRQLLEDGLAMGSPTGFHGSLNALYAGDKLVACHFGLWAGQTLHYWFPVYDQAYAYYQPGLVLLKLTAEQGAGEGLSFIDLGRGTQSYKMRFCTQTVALGEGAVSRPALLAQAAIASQKTKARLKANPQVVQFRQWLANRKAPADKTPPAAL